MDRRSKHRFTFNPGEGPVVTLKGPGQGSWPVELVNLSLFGMCVRLLAKEDRPPDDGVPLRACLPQLELPCEVVHSRPDSPWVYLGLRFLLTAEAEATQQALLCVLAALYRDSMAEAVGARH